MLEALSKRLRRDEDGFTLIELMVVVLIIAILIAIAIPTFLGARERAQDKAAQSNIRNAVESAEVYYTDNEEYTADVAVMEDLEPQLDWGNANAAEGGVQIFANDQLVIARSESAAGTVYCMAKIATNDPGGTYNAGTYYARACTGAETAATVSTWQPSTAGWKA
ncbi:MAG TPA: prepilin-type N-terminal cleavage/methylation domain-containing protein [Actinomycetota bacterium]|nr:prepilin-type N-terminal cleavage/methylation domain-containing protein [Actinomycetota bacterium]